MGALFTPVLAMPMLTMVVLKGKPISERISEPERIPDEPISEPEPIPDPEPSLLRMKRCKVCGGRYERGEKGKPCPHCGKVDRVSIVG